VESELLGQFSLTTVLFVASWSYARQANRRPAALGSQHHPSGRPYGL
jgi:hypothetical protein